VTNRRLPASLLVSGALLVAGNLIPLAGVLYFDWDIRAVLITYWLENGIVGLINVPKMMLASDRTQPWSTVGAADSPGGRAIFAVFFLFHYGIFWVVHGVFILMLTGAPFIFGVGDPLSFVLADRGLLLTALALLLSHGASFFLNYLGRGEYRRTSVGGQMFAPYPRLFVLHITIILGGFAVLALGQPTALVALLVLLKTAFDLVLHIREHTRHSRQGAPAKGSDTMRGVNV
jgi:hypothetical protein